MIPREINVPESRIFKPVGDSYADAIQKALDGWFVYIGVAVNDISDEAIDSFIQDAYDTVVSRISRDIASDLEIVVDPPVFSIGRRLFLTRRGNCTYQLVGVGEDGLEYERV